MKNKSKSSLFITVLSCIALIMALIIPSLYIPSISYNQNGTLVMGFLTTFGGKVAYQGYQATIGFPVGLFLAWFFILCAGLLAFFFGTGQKSTYFFTFLLFVASIVLYALTRNITVGDKLVAGSIQGFSSGELCAQPYVMITLNSIGAIASLVAIFYKPNRRTSRYR